MPTKKELRSRVELLQKWLRISQRACVNAQFDIEERDEKIAELDNAVGALEAENRLLTEEVARLTRALDRPYLADPGCWYDCE